MGKPKGKGTRAKPPTKAPGTLKNPSKKKANQLICDMCGEGTIDHEAQWMCDKCLLKSISGGRKTRTKRRKSRKSRKSRGKRRTRRR